MSARRGSAESTKKRILEAARKLFAEHGADSVSVRRVAAEAGINHALVHRYFGTKAEMLAAIIRQELRNVSALTMAHPAADPAQSLDHIRKMLHLGMTDLRTTIRLIMRAEMDGLAPETMIDQPSARSLRVLADWIHTLRPGSDPLEAQLTAAVTGAALFGLTTAAPWFLTAVGLDAADLDARRDALVETILGVIARAAGIAPVPPANAGSEGAADVTLA